MIDRRLILQINKSLRQFPAVALLGPRQVGKTTLAHELAKNLDCLHLDLESPKDIRRLDDNVESYLASHEQQLVIIDEIQHFPDLFKVLRVLIDAGQRRGLPAGRFLLLGSASLKLMHQASESLAGRIAHLELQPFDVQEVADLERLWLRGGFPKSFLAQSNVDSLDWRMQFVRRYIESDMTQLGYRLPMTTSFRLWTMLAHMQGNIQKPATIAKGLGLKVAEVNRYIDSLVDLLLVRRLPPWHHAGKKRLIKSPKLYLRDSGVCHALLGLVEREMLLGHPVVGYSWEGFVIENLLSSLACYHEANFYRTANGGEIDLVITPLGRKPWVIEIKRSEAPSLSNGFHFACQDILPEAKFIVYAGHERYPLGRGVEAIGLLAMCQELSKIS